MAAESTPVTIVPAPQSEDTSDLLAPFLALAVSWSLDTPERTAADVLGDPELKRYVAGWGRRGDLVVVAYPDGEDPADPDGEAAAVPDGYVPIGAAWLRLFSADEPGYGYVGADIPELAVAVAREHQGEGIGTRLVRTLLDMARLTGAPGVSLSVQQANGAIVLYSKLGFEEIGVDAGDGAVIMLKRF